MDADYKVEGDPHYKAVASDGEWTAEDTADEGEGGEDGDGEEGDELEKTQDLEMEVEELIEEQKQPVNGENICLLPSPCRSK